MPSPFSKNYSVSWLPLGFEVIMDEPKIQMVQKQLHGLPEVLGKIWSNTQKCQRVNKVLFVRKQWCQS